MDFHLGLGGRGIWMIGFWDTWLLCFGLTCAAHFDLYWKVGNSRDFRYEWASALGFGVGSGVSLGLICLLMHIVV